MEDHLPFPYVPPPTRPNRAGNEFSAAAFFQDMGYRMVIWPVSSLRVANKAQETLFSTLRRDGSAQALLGAMQTRAELYDLIGLHQYEALDASIVETIVPQAMPGRAKQRSPS